MTSLPPRALTVSNRQPPAANRLGARNTPIGRAQRGVGAGAGATTLLAKLEGAQAQARAQQPHWLRAAGAARRVRAPRAAEGVAAETSGRAMLRLAGKVVGFFWRRAEEPEEEAGPPGPELAEGASREGLVRAAP